MWHWMHLFKDIDDTDEVLDIKDRDVILDKLIKNAPKLQLLLKDAAETVFLKGEIILVFCAISGT